MDDRQEPEAGKRRGRAVSCMLQLALWLALPLLLYLYLLYAVETQSGFLYPVVSGTPVEHQALKVLPFLWRHKTFLERQAMNSDLTAQERLASKQLFHRMERMRPTHSLQMKNGSFLFGRPTHTSGEGYILSYYEDNHRVEKTVSSEQIESITPLVMGHREFTQKNLRFILSFPNLNHYYLDPYLLVSEVSFSSAMELYGILALFEDQFRSHFGPLIRQSDDHVVQVAYFASRESLVRHLSTELPQIPNATAFFSKKTNTLYLYKNQPSDNPSSAHMFHSILLDSSTDRKEKKQALFKVIRHEGAHHLAASMGALEGLDTIPFWIEEGIAQYCETAPFGEPHPEKLAFLRNTAKDKKLLAWDTLMSATQEDVSKLSDLDEQRYYAQAWLLFNYMMTKNRRAPFLSFMLKIREKGMWEDSDNIDLATTLRTTWSRIDTDLMQTLTPVVTDEKPVPSG